MGIPRQFGDRFDPHEEAPHHTADDETTNSAASILWLDNPSQLITTISYKLGYWPSPNSLVVIGLQHRQVALSVAAEIPAAADLSRPDDVAIAWEAFGFPLQSSGADAAVIIAYTTAERTAEIRQFANAAPLPVAEVLRVWSGRFWFLDCHHADCTSPGCRPDGAKLVNDPHLAATLILEGASSPGTRQDLVRSLQPGPAALIDSVAAVLARNPIPDQKVLEAAVTQAHGARIDKPAPLHPWDAALLLQAVADIDVRDACLIWRDDAAWWLWCDLIRNAPPGWVAPVATLIATTAYQRGHGVMAHIAAEVALADQPDYEMANSVQTCLEIAVPPDEFRAAITMAEALRLCARELESEHDTAAHRDQHDDPTS